MAQRDKVKELVGRGLDSYHTKSLQQIDRIEKKNKEQNHKISILSNELDNDYLTKTEEGSVVSLEHSKEGMVYLDELQGNTLVNYCTDGSKEMTLNGDIDVEGTFVAITEGVDNGKVDVMCEGNTLVGEFLRIPTPNLQGNEFDDFTIVDKNDYWECRGIANKNNVVMSVNAWSCELGLKALKEGVEYTVIVYDCPVNSMMKNYLIRDNNIGENFNTVIGTNKWKIIAKSDGLIYGFYSYSNNVNLGEECIINFPKKVLLLEGDWTNKEIPPYFEGMKSVGQDDENGHKIEILSQTLNLVDDFSKYVKGSNQVTFTKINNHSFSVEGDGSYKWQQVNFNIPFIQNAKAGDTFTLFAEEITLLNQDTSSDIGIQMRNTTLNMSISNSWQVNANKPVRNGLIKFTIPNNYNGTDILDLRVHVNHNVALANKVTIKNLMIAKGHVDISSFKPYGLNKKEISLNEPLRKSNDNVKDRFVKIGNKYYIERNCQQLTINGNEPNVTWRSDGVLNNNVYRFWSNNFPNCITLNQEGCIYTGDYEKVYQANAINVHVSTSKITEDSVELFVEYLKQNPLTVVIKRATPIYEPIEDAELITYLDTTHISNNSIIPCTMKVKNSGYNAIIKPSTLYTIALDTNKSGTIGMNLGGAKGTTTNNVTTITTPATLTDDSLRIYGKGIKGSKVRLLEGDKTNWIPSHFEGMKSSFEDKFDTTDNTYKMEILSNNENLLDLTQHSIGTPYTNHYIIKNNSIIGIYEGDNYTDFQIWFNLKRNRTYKLSYSQESTHKLNGSNSQLLIGKRSSYSEDCMLHQCYNGNAGIITNIPYDGWYTLHFHSLKNNNTIKDLQLKESNLPTDFVERKYNKIQFSSIKPLRKWDRFVLKDNQLMIERGSGTFVLNSKNGYGLSAGGWENKTDVCTFEHYKPTPTAILNNLITFYTDSVPSLTFHQQWSESGAKGREGMSTHQQGGFVLSIKRHKLISQDVNGLDKYLRENPIKVTYKLEEPTYEEVPFELQKIILEGYENGTLFFDTNIPPTSTVTYAGETPIVKSVKLNKTEVSNNTDDINDNIIPYLMDMDYRVVCLQLATEEIEGGVSMARLFGGAYEMLQRDIQSKRYSVDEYRHRLDAYLGANKITEEEYIKLGDMLNE